MRQRTKLDKEARRRFLSLPERKQFDMMALLPMESRIQLASDRAVGLLGEAAFAAAVGKSMKQVSRYGARDDFPFSFLTKLAEAADIPLSWLTRTVEQGPTTAMEEGLVSIPFLDLAGSPDAGTLDEVRRRPGEFLRIHQDRIARRLPGWATSQQVVGMLDGFGDHMEPTFPPNAIAIVVRSPPWAAVAGGGVFVLGSGNRKLLVRRLQASPDGDLVVSSDNKAYSHNAETIPAAEAEDRINVQGQVFSI